MSYNNSLSNQHASKWDELIWIMGKFTSQPMHMITSIKRRALTIINNIPYPYMLPSKLCNDTILRPQKPRWVCKSVAVYESLVSAKWHQLLPLEPCQRKRILMMDKDTAKAPKRLEWGCTVYSKPINHWRAAETHGGFVRFSPWLQ